MNYTELKNAAKKLFECFDNSPTETRAKMLWTLYDSKAHASAYNLSMEEAIMITEAAETELM